MKLTVIGLLVVALMSSTGIPEYPERGEPIESSALEADLIEAGYRNARLPKDLLVEVESNNRKRCYLEKEAAEAWEAMLVHAEHDGIRIEATSCYRDLRAQQEAYNWNCPNGKCRVPTARPGNSHHGWGRAIDFTSRGRLLSCRSATFQWLKEHAHLYGWVHPAWAGCGRTKSEPWHWEWAGTETTPRIVVTRSMAL